jgi:hypothetical protein
MRQAAEDAAGFGEKPSSSHGPEPAAAESVFRLAEIAVDPSSAFLAGSLHLADHVSANLPPDSPPTAADTAPSPLPGTTAPGSTADPPSAPRQLPDPARNGHQPRP